MGAENNTKTVVRYRNNSLGEVATPSLLSCTEVRNFWISWHNATLRVGRGYIYSLDFLLEASVSGFARGCQRPVANLGMKPMGPLRPPPPPVVRKFFNIFSGGGHEDL